MSEKFELKGQDFVRKVCQESLDLVQRGGEQYVDVDLKNQANTEARTVRDYRGRYVFELLQNANDAILADRDKRYPSNERKYRVRVELTETALLIANDGEPFKEKDVDSIYRWGESSKDPNKSVGYKGIGFKSVLEITESPQVFSNVVQFHFDKNLCYEQIRAIVGDSPDLKLPFTRFVFSFSIEEVKPEMDRELVNRLLNNELFATVIRLPFKEGIQQGDIIQRIEDDIDPALLLFLNGIDQIDVWILGQLEHRWIREINYDNQEVGRPNNGLDVSIISSTNGKRRLNSRWLLFESPKIPVEDRELISDLGDEVWDRVKKVGFSLAFPLTPKRGSLVSGIEESSSLYVYFPTRMGSGVKYRIHGDFYIESARKYVEALDYNCWLADKIARYLRVIVIPELVQRFPEDWRVIEMLIPVEVDGFAEKLLAAILDELKSSPFIPAKGGGYISPVDAVLAPDGTWENLSNLFLFFLEEDLSKTNGQQYFPNSEIYDHVNIIDWLLTLGANQLSYQNVIQLIGKEPWIKGPDKAAEFYDFLWDWREQLDVHQRQWFSSALRGTECILSSENCWVKPHSELYHAKLRLETPNMPECVQADLIHPEVYQGEGRDSSVYKLCSEFSPRIRDYDAPAIIRSGILPLFESGRFRRLLVKDRVEIYQYLFAYFQSRRTGDDELERGINKIEIQAQMVTDKRKQKWLSVEDVYLSSYWTGDKRLEEIYQDFQGIYFLYGIRGLEIDNDERQDWEKFWRWLGINVAPRVHIQDHKYDRPSWTTIDEDHPHAGTQLWNDYTSTIRSEFGECPRHGKDRRRLVRSVTLEGFPSLIEDQKADRLQLMIELMAENWGEIGHIIRENTKVECYRPWSYCKVNDRKETVPTFANYLLNNSSWVPAQVFYGGKPQLALLQPSQCWFVSKGEESLIQDMLPTPLINPDSSNTYYRFCKSVGMQFLTEASLEDLVGLINWLPEQYPDPNILVPGRGRRRSAVASMTRWIAKRIDNLLDKLDEKISPIEDRIKLVGTQNGRYHYVEPPEPIFFKDDRYHAVQWASHVPFATIDNQDSAAARYLGVSFISEHVDEKFTAGKILLDESERLDKRFQRSRPYLLALVDSQRKSETTTAARRLKDLEIRLVERLVVNRTLSLGEGKTIVDAKAKVFLHTELTSEKGKRGRRKTGILYLHQGEEENYDLLGSPIAEFLEIPGLADAFVIILDRCFSKDKTLQFLGTRDIQEEDVEAMRLELRRFGVHDDIPEDVQESVEEPPVGNKLLEEFKKNQQSDDGNLTGIPQESDEEEDVTPELKPDGDESEEFPKGETAEGKKIEFPDIDYDQVDVERVDTTGSSIKKKVRTRWGGSGGGWSGGGNWQNDQKLLDAYGLRGEEVVYQKEIERLKDMGIESPKNRIRWLRQEGLTTADHDFESLEYQDGEWITTVIEVKATPGWDFRFPISVSELECAWREGNKYRLYRVIDVASETPQVFIFDNPYILWEKDQANLELKDAYVTLPDPTK